MTGLEFKNRFESIFPTHLAYKWDNVGLQIGTLDKDITSILITLDLTLEVLEEATRKECNLVLVHHPIIFSPLKNILTDTYQGKVIEYAIKNDISIYVAHTNFDIGNTGMNKILADMLGLSNQTIIEMTTENEGLGRKGTIEKTTLNAFINGLKTTFKINDVKVIGDLNKKITTVAISGGSGSSLLKHPNMQDVDVYVSGDISYHHALDALNDGLTVIDVGHNIEKHALHGLKSILSEYLEISNIHVSEVDTNPYKTI